MKFWKTLLYVWWIFFKRSFYITYKMYTLIIDDMRMGDSAKLTIQVIVHSEFPKCVEFDFQPPDPKYLKVEYC